MIDNRGSTATASLDLADLNRPSGVAWRDAAEAPPISFDQVLAAGDPLEMAARAWRLAQDPAGAGELFERITISFGDALDRCRHESLAFARASVEAARQKSLLDGTSDWLIKARTGLEDARLEAFAGPRLRALGALAAVYQADELRAIGHLEEAAQLSSAALASVPQEEIEIRARMLEIASNLARDRGETERAGELLVAAEEIGRDLGIPGRLAEIRLRQARLMVSLRRFRVAHGLLLAAADDLPERRDLRLRLEILHERLGVHVALREFEQAGKVWQSARGLYGHKVSDRLMRAERDRLMGRLALECGSAPDASTLLESAIRQLLAAHQVGNALSALADLNRAWCRLEAFPDRVPRGLELLGLFRSCAGIDRIDRTHLQPLVDLAATTGVDLDELLEWRERPDQIN